MAEAAPTEDHERAAQQAIAQLLATTHAAAERDPQAALAEALAREAAARTQGRERDLADAQLCGGVLYQRISRYDLALVALRTACDLYQRQRRPAGLAAARRALGHVHDELGEYAQALAEYMHALALDEAGGNAGSRANTLRTIGIIYSKAGDPEQGLAFYRDSLALNRQLGDPVGTARSLNNIGINQKNLGRLPQAREALAEALDLFRAQGSTAGLAGALSNLALVHDKMGELAEAEALMREALAHARSAGYPIAEVNALRGLGEVLLHGGDPAQAQAVLDEGLKVAEAMTSRPERARCHRALADVYKAQGNPAAALEHFERFYEIERELFNEASDRKLRALQVTYQVAQLTRQGSEDALTGAANRRHLDERLAIEFAAARQRGRRLALALVDVDDFKQVNDRHSHAIGDAALKVVAQLMRAHCRDADLVARYGGEEFALLLPDTDAARAARVGEKLRASIAAHPWQDVAPALRVTVSIGVADDAGHADVAALLACADRRMYAAKRGGKDRVIAAG